MFIAGSQFVPWIMGETISNKKSTPRPCWNLTRSENHGKCNIGWVKTREWFYPPRMTGIDTLFLMNADRAVALDGLMESLQRLKSPVCLSAVDGKATANEWTKAKTI